MLITWKVNTARFATGYLGFLGQVPLFNLFYNPCRPKDSKDAWRLTTELPGFRNPLGDYDTNGVAMKRAEAALKEWLATANLQVKP